MSSLASASTSSQMTGSNSAIAPQRFRLYAVLIHLAVSAVIIASVSAVALLSWFPYPLFLLDGTWVAVLTLAAVDLVLGPCITLIVASSKKPVKELVFDFSVVLAVQIAALAFGLMQISTQKIVALVHIENDFHLVADVRASGFDDENSLPEFNGIRYGMLEQADFTGLTKSEIELKMFDPNAYHALDTDTIKRKLFPAELVDERLLARYGDGYYFKAIAGKRRNGVAVLNEQMEIVAFGLTSEKD